MSSATCPYCRSPVGDRQPTVRCSACQTLLHRDCREELGRCPTLSCGGRPEAEPDAPAPPFTRPVEPVDDAELRRRAEELVGRNYGPGAPRSYVEGELADLRRRHEERRAKWLDWARRYPRAAAELEARAKPRRLGRRTRPRPAAKGGPMPKLQSEELLAAGLAALHMTPARRRSGVARLLRGQRERWQAWAWLNPEAAEAHLRAHPEHRRLVE